MGRREERIASSSDKRSSTSNKQSSSKETRSKLAEPQSSSQLAEKKSKDPIVFLSGVPFKVDEDTLRKDFGKFGEIKKFFFRKDEDGRSVGEATIVYSSIDEADKVLLLDGIEYKGRNIKVKRRAPRGRSGQKTR